MLYAIITSILGSLDEVLWKKTLIYKVPEYLNTLFWYITGLFFAFYFIFNVDFTLLNYKFFVLITIMLMAYILSTKFSQSIYREEKISVLMPYTNINSALTIILSFFIFLDVSLVSFFITLLTIIIIILFSIDYKLFRFPRNIVKMFLHEIILTLYNIIVWFLVISYWEWLLFIFDFFVWSIILIIISAYFWYFSFVKKLKKNYLIPRLGWSFLWWWAYAISLLIISELWLSMSILLWFVWMWITLLLSYVILKDKPTNKDLLLTVIVTWLVWIWYYFK